MPPFLKAKFGRSKTAGKPKLPKPPPYLPTEVAAAILSHLKDDTRTLKNAALVSRNFCFLAQELLFSTIMVEDKTVQRLFVLEEMILSSPRGENIAMAIQTLSFMNVRTLFRPSEDEHDHIRGLRIIQFIADRAKRFRALHFGPFSSLSFTWKLLKDEGRSILSRLFTMAESVIIEGFLNIPTSLFLQLKKLKSLDITPSCLAVLDTTVEPALLPSPRSLALHDGILGPQRWSPNETPLDLRSRLAVNFSDLQTLYLYLPMMPGRNALYRDIIASCSSRLESLRFYVSGDDPGDEDRAAVDLSRLTSLRSLFVMVNVKDSLGCMTKIVNTLSIPQTHLKNLALFIDSDDTNLEEDAWFEDAVSHANQKVYADAWKTLDLKLTQVLSAWDDTQIYLQIPPVDPVMQEDVYEFFDEQLPELVMHDAMYKRFHLLDFSFRNIIRAHLTFREDDDQARIVKDFAKMMNWDA